MNNNWQTHIEILTEKIFSLRNYQPRITSNTRLLILKDNSRINFTSNDYLGLSLDPKLQKAVASGCSQYGIGSSGAPGLSGYSEAHQVLADNLANWLGFEKALIFASGYQLNSSIYRQLVDAEAMLWFDRKCHASHIDGIILSKAKFNSFEAKNFDLTRQRILDRPQNRHILITEGTFSMDGTCTYLGKLLELKQLLGNQLLLIIDDAHGIGVLGQEGFGTIEQLGLDHHLIDLYIGTFSKGFGCHGGFIVGNKLLINYLQQTTRSQLFSSALPPLIMTAANKSLEIISSLSGKLLRQQLVENINYFRQLAKAYQLELYQTETNISPIQLLNLKTKEAVQSITKNLAIQGIQVGGIVYPTVPKDMSRLRISLSAFHTKEDIQILCGKLATFIEKSQLI